MLDVDQGPTVASPLCVIPSYLPPSLRLPPSIHSVSGRLRLFAPFFFTLWPPFFVLLLCFVPHLHPICTCLQVSAARTHLNNTGSRKLGGSTWNRNQNSGTWLFSFLFQCLGRDLVYPALHPFDQHLESLRLCPHLSRSFLTPTDTQFHSSLPPTAWTTPSSSKHSLILWISDRPESSLPPSHW